MSQAPLSIRLTFNDSPMPMSGALPASTDPNKTDGNTANVPAPHTPTRASVTGTVRAPVRDNGELGDIRDLLAQLVQQGNERLYFGAVEPEPRHLGQIDPRDLSGDQSVMETPQPVFTTGSADRETMAENPYQRTRTDPGQTEGGGPPPGMYQQMIGNYPMSGVEDVYWCLSEGNKLVVYHRNTNRPNVTEIADSFPYNAGDQFWWDQTADAFRVFKLAREKVLDLGDVTGDAARDYGRIKAGFASDRATAIRNINAANRNLWRL